MSEPVASAPPPDPAPWGLKGAIVVPLLYMGVQIVCSLVLAGLAYILLLQLEPNLVNHPKELPELVLQVIVGPVGLTSTICILWLIYTHVVRVWRRPFFASLRLRRPTLRGLAGFLVLGASVNLTFIAVMQLFPYPENKAEGPLTKLAESGTLGQIIWVVMALVLAPIAEEVLYRGYAYLGARRKLGPAWAGVLVTLLFVPPHMGETGAYCPALAGVATLATILILVIERTDNLTYCIACHLGYNAALASVALFAGA